MTRTIEVEVDDAGRICPLEASAQLPRGRALLTWETENEHEMALLSETALASDWLRPEEDEAWAHLQPLA